MVQFVKASIWLLTILFDRELHQRLLCTKLSTENDDLSFHRTFSVQEVEDAQLADSDREILLKKW